MTVELSVSIGRYPHVRSLFEAPQPVGDDLLIRAEPGGTMESATSILHGGRFDIGELPIVNYLSAREHGFGATAIPVFLTRRFPHDMVVVNTGAGVASPGDLAGRQVGIPYHGNTDVVWVRGVLADRYGVDPASITWVTARSEQVTDAPLPANVEQRLGEDLVQLLERGELPAQIRGTGPGHLASNTALLWTEPEVASEKYFGETGIFPILHTVVVRDELLDAYPALAKGLVRVFEDAKRRGLAELESGRPLDADERHLARYSGFPTGPSATRERSYLGEDPIPYGIGSNRHNLETVIRYASEQQVIAGTPALSELFVGT